MKYADDLELLAKEETVLQGMIDRLKEMGRCCHMEMNVERAMVMRISGQRIVADQKLPEKVEYFN